MKELTTYGTPINGIPPSYSREYTSDKHKTWINLKCVMLSKKNLTQNVTQFLILFIWHSKNGKIIRTETKLCIPGIQSGKRG